MRCHIVEKKGRKISVEGTVEDLEGKILARARCAYPKYNFCLIKLISLFTQGPLCAAKICQDVEYENDYTSTRRAACRCGRDSRWRPSPALDC